MREPAYSNEEMEKEKILRKIRRSTLKFKPGDDVFGTIQSQLNIFRAAEKQGFFDQLTNNFTKNWADAWNFYECDELIPEAPEKIIDDTKSSTHPYAVVFPIIGEGSYEDFARLTKTGKEWLIEQINTLTPIKIVDIDFDSENSDNITDVCEFEFTDQYNVIYRWEKYYCRNEEPIQRIDVGYTYDYDKLSRDELVVLFGENSFWFNYHLNKICPTNGDK